MNKEVLKFIDQIIAKVTKADISALEVEVEGVKVRAERETKLVSVAAPNIAASLGSVHSEPKLETAEESATADGNVIKSPIVGTFYNSASPADKPFIKVGDHVSKGLSVCIIEAMKIMNEIESEFDGIVKEILVTNGSLVEYGQPLIVIG